MGGCNCKKKTVENSQAPVAEPEESYRQAFLRESRKTSELASRLADAEKEMEELRIANGSLNYRIGVLTGAPRIA